MSFRSVLVISLVMSMLGRPIAQGLWRDSAPHRVSLVPVEDRVQIEVLDFGGTGRPIVFLAGLGDTAHVYDDFAPRLTGAGFHVYAMTRRGFGASSAPVAGYTFARLAADVVGVIDGMSLNKPIVVGHSIAGEELNVLGREYTAKIGGLVYLDAAVNRTRGPSADFQRAAGALPSPPPPTAEELRSYSALRGYFARTRTVARPEAEVRASRVVAADGSIGAQRPTDPTVRQAITTMLQRPELPQWDRIQTPALAVYPVPESVSDLMMPWYDVADSTLTASVATMYAEARARAVRWADEFKGSVPNGRTVEVPGGSHHVFLSSPDQTQRLIVEFASTLQEKR